MSEPPLIDIVIESALWKNAPGATDWARTAIGQAILTGSVKLKSGVEISVLLTDDASIRKLNAQWRGKDQPTNVLSFPSPGAVETRASLGDIVIAYETSEGEARAEHKTFQAHLTHLVVHGFLHLLGLDHETDEDAAQMESLERRILAALGIADPYVVSVGVA